MSCFFSSLSLLLSSHPSSLAGGFLGFSLFSLLLLLSTPKGFLLLLSGELFRLLLLFLVENGDLHLHSLSHEF